MNWIACFPLLIAFSSITSAEPFTADDLIEGADADGIRSKHPEFFNPPIFVDNLPEADHIQIPENDTPTHRRSKRAVSGPAIIEIVVVVDKEFADMYGQDYFRIKDYLTAYFWDINMRYKTLLTANVSFRFNGLLVQTTKESQPFIENARKSDGTAPLDKILLLFREWIYKRRDWLLKFDMAILITNTKTDFSGGLSYPSSICNQDAALSIDWASVVWTDNGSFNGVPVGAHEIGHSLGAPHDDQVGCPYGYLMGSDCGGYSQNRYFFSKCTDAAISQLINSPQGDCLRRYDGYETTPMDRNFSTPKAGTMADLCKAGFGPTATLVTDMSNCTLVVCSRAGLFGIPPYENIQCGNGGRCYRGKCRPESKLLKNEASGFCMNADNRVFNYMVPARMFPCPSSKDKTPLDTIEIQSVPIPVYKRLATPFLYNDNQESGNRCFWTGMNEGDTLWTDRCGDNPWQYWELRPINGNANRFQLVHKETQRCARVMANSSDSYLESRACTTDATMVWSWTDGV